MSTVTLSPDTESGTNGGRLRGERHGSGVRLRPGFQRADALDGGSGRRQRAGAELRRVGKEHRAVLAELTAMAVRAHARITDVDS